MTLIDGDKLADSIKDKLCDHLYCRDCSMCLEDGGCKVEKWLDEAPSIDIVRCKECKYYDNEDYGEPTRYCTWHESVVNADDFCSYGERREP